MAHSVLGIGRALAILQGFDATHMRDFMGRVIEAFERKEAEGRDAFLYEAPLAIYFHTSSLAGPADPIPRHRLGGSETQPAFLFFSS